CGVWVCCPRVWSCECWWCSCVLCIANSFLVLPHACSVVVFDCRAGGGGGGTSLNFLKWKGRPTVPNVEQGVDGSHQNVPCVRTGAHFLGRPLPVALAEDWQRTGRGLTEALIGLHTHEA